MPTTLPFWYSYNTAHSAICTSCFAHSTKHASSPHPLPLNNLPDPPLKRLNHLIRDLRRRRLAQRRIHRIREQKLNMQRDLRPILRTLLARLLRLVRSGLRRRLIWELLQTPACHQMAQHTFPPRGIGGSICRSRRVVFQPFRGEGSIRASADGFDGRVGYTVDSRVELFAYSLVVSHY